MNLDDLDNNQSIDTTWYTTMGEGKFKTQKTTKVNITRKGDRFWLKFPYNKKILEEIKGSFTGYKWHGFDSPPIKQWSIKACPHNYFQILFLMGRDPYATYDQQFLDIDFETRENADGRLIPPYEHQKNMARHILTCRYVIDAFEMSTGKSRACVMAMEASGLTDWLWVGPRAALHAVELEFKQWRSKIKPTFVTYSGLKKHNEEWPVGKPVYQGIIFDEASKLKNPVAQRTIAAAYLADQVRKEWGPEGIVVLMSGTPAPKSPVDWYGLSEVACPGFLREGHVNLFKNNLAVIRKQESVTGGAYPQLVTWKDNELKCNTCGQMEDHECHNILNIVENDEDCPYHQYVRSVNEVERLHRRLKGLVLVGFKKDLLDLPDKQYKKIYCKPSKAVLRAAKLIAATASSTIKALTLLRQLSDGFQYTETEIGKKECPTCKGRRVTNEPVYIGPDKTWEYLASIQAVPTWMDLNDGYNQPDDVVIDVVAHPDLYRWEEIACGNCHGSGEITTYQRTTDSVDCPKDDVLKDILEQHEDVGRIVIFGGFTGTIDHITELVTKENWEIIRVDGRGWHSTIGGNPAGMLEAFQKHQEQFPKIAFVGQPGAAGLGLNLMAAPSIVYFSNDFNAESRIQSEDRIHRPGMDKNRGATIYDLIHLPTDEYVLENLMKKRKLQNMSLGDLGTVLENISDEPRYN